MHPVNNDALTAMTSLSQFSHKSELNEAVSSEPLSFTFPLCTLPTLPTLPSYVLSLHWYELTTTLTFLCAHSFFFLHSFRSLSSTFLLCTLDYSFSCSATLLTLPSFYILSGIGDVPGVRLVAPDFLVWPLTSIHRVVLEWS